ncbi:MAG: DNA mismatch repair endonuclease MutL [Myxococcota bacterium]|jgi:DNA mismatch repair protein MutL|nr:DNA mismatch repair endonuclease MutL [Myxococcota bacterium]
MSSVIGPRAVRLLPPELCNQIAAGEVIERPASVVKELVENALDAGASRIRVDIEEGGRKLIRVSDDGWGMSASDARTALLRHATSKIASVEDLNAIRTLGFRGEALAAIASVSHTTLATRVARADTGCLIEVSGGRIQDEREAGLAPGTSIEVRELFFNTPARLKFLKSDLAELRRIQTMLQRLAMVAPGVHVQLFVDGRARLDVPPHQALSDRVLSLLGAETHAALRPLESSDSDDDYRVGGLYSDPRLHYRSGTPSYVFVNGRWVQDRTISAAINTAYRDLLPSGRVALVVLLLELPPEFVDVNVHPTKIELRFRDSDRVFRLVYHRLRDALGRSTPTDVASAEEPERAASAPRPALSMPAQQASLPLSRPLDDFLQRAAGIRDAGSAPTLYPQLSSKSAELACDAAGHAGAEAPQDSARMLESQISRVLDAGREGPHEASMGQTSTGYSDLRYIGQLAHTYLLASDGRGLVVIDQHAAHERITYQRLLAARAGQPIAQQRLLFPELLELDALRAAALEEFGDYFASLGFELEPFGAGSFALHAVPAMLAGSAHEKLIKEALTELVHHERSQRIDEAYEAVIARMACHASVRAGQSMSAEEAYSLFAQMDEVEFRGQCPHGRPVSFRMSLDEIERRFGRR